MNLSSERLRAVLPTGRSKLADDSTGRLIDRAAVFCLAVGVLVIVAWFAGWPLLSRLLPEAPDMVLDTAICFILIAAALWFAHRRIAAPVRLVAAILIPAGLFNFFVRDAKLALQSHVFPLSTPQQMAEGTALAFVLTGVALLLLSQSKRYLPALRATAVLGTMVASIGLITLLGYAVGLSSAPWWSGTFLFEMALPTAITCCVIGVALIAFFWREAGGRYQLSVTTAALAFFCLLLLVGGADASLWASSGAILASRAPARAISNELFSTYALVDSVHRAETGLHAYLLTGDERYLKMFSAGDLGLNEIASHRGVRDTQLLASVQLKLDELRRIIALEKQGNHAEAIGIVKGQAGLQSMDQIEHRAATVIAGLQEDWGQRRNRNTRSVASIQTTILWSYAMVIQLACCALWLVGMEIKRRARVEADLRTIEGKLETTISELREETVRANEANRTKSSFLASMSHEIRTPMNAILGISDLLWDSELSQTQRHYVEVFRRAGGNLLTLINGILDLSKIESGSFELESTGFDIRELVEQVVETLTHKAEAKGLCLVAGIASATTTNVVGDPARLQQVLFNLVGNAIKFTEQGEVVLKVSSHASATHASLQFEVSDTGIGISAEQLPRIFDEFKQAETSTARRFGGTGLGLGISRRLISYMGGAIRVRSEPGKGSVFSFDVVLPIDGEPKLAAASHLKGVVGKRVLIVDDIATNRDVLGEMTAGWGMLVTTCASGSEAIELAASAQAGQPFDLVLIEKVMPGTDGFETAGQIMGLASRPAILIVSSDPQDGDTKRVRDLGLSGHLMKPVRRAELLREIAKAFGGVSEPAASRVNPVESKPAQSVPAHQADNSNGRVRVLVAEDSEDNRFLLDAYCQGSAYELTFAGDGQQAVDAFLSGEFEMIVMDVQMPVIDGLTATTQIRALESNRGSHRIPILALTANASQNDLMHALEAGCDAHLSKPISKKDLLKALKQWQAQPVA